MQVNDFEYSDAQVPAINYDFCHGAHIVSYSSKKLFDLRPYIDKPIFGHNLPAYSSMKFKCTNLVKIADINKLSVESIHFFENIYIATQKLKSMMDFLKLNEFELTSDLPILKLSSKLNKESFASNGIHIDQSNYNDNSLFLYLPLCLTDMNLENLVSRIKKAATQSV